MSRLKQAAIGAVTLLMFAQGEAQALTCQFVNDPWWMSQHVATQGGLISLVQGLQTALSGAMTYTNQMVVSAVAVHTKQIDADTQRLAAARVGSNQAMASAMLQQDRNLRVARVQEDFSINSGQGVNACQTIALMNGVNSAIEERSSAAAEAAAALDVAPGSGTTVPAAVKRRLATLDKTDAALLFSTSSSAADKNAVIEQMVGLPPPKPVPGQAGAEAEGMMLTARRIESLRSPAMVSLQAVASFYSRHSHGGTSWPVGLQGEYGADASQSEALDALIAQYGGGPAYEQWSAGLAAQSERGLLIELTRLRAMAVKLRGLETEQRARMAVVTAADLALQTGGL